MYILALIFYHQQTSGPDRRYFVNYFKRSLAYPGVKIYFHIKITEIIYIFRSLYVGLKTRVGSAKSLFLEPL